MVIVVKLNHIHKEGIQKYLFKYQYHKRFPVKDLKYIYSPADTMACEHNHFTPQQRFKCTSDHCRKPQSSVAETSNSQRCSRVLGLTMHWIIVDGGWGWGALTRILWCTNKPHHPSVGDSS